MNLNYTLRTLALAILFSFVATEINAQIFVTGQVGFTSSESSQRDDFLRSTTIVPKVGFFLSEKFVVGANIGFSRIKDASDKDNYSTENGFIVGPFIRLRSELESNFAIYGELGLNFQTSKGKSFVNGAQFGNDQPSTNIIDLYIGPGIEYYLNDRWFINALWGALSYERTSREDITWTDFGLNLNPGNVQFGVSYMFGN